MRMRYVKLPSGRLMPVLGQGTWRMGEARSRRAAELAALRRGLELGLTLIDTAEMYGEGGAERLVGAAIEGRRDQVFLVSKVYPHNASRDGVQRACERSLKRLGTDRLDLYLLHWPGEVPLAETVAGFAALKAAGKILDWGVSNFDLGEMAELPKGCATDQVLYNLARRGIEHDLLPWCRRRRMPVMAYTPLEPERLARNKALAAIAAEAGVPPLTLALAWVIRQPGVVAIPKASSLEHVRANRAALGLKLTADLRAALDRAFPPPKRREPLAML